MLTTPIHFTMGGWRRLSQDAGENGETYSSDNQVYTALFTGKADHVALGNGFRLLQGVFTTFAVV